MSKIRNYKGVKVNSMGLPIFKTARRELRKRGTPNRVREIYHVSFVSPFQKSSPKNLIVMYDIPSGLKKERDWLRRHLVKFGYIMIQKSVWLGPSPLPKEFLSYLKKIEIGDNFKT